MPKSIGLFPIASVCLPSFIKSPDTRYKNLLSLSMTLTDNKPIN